MWQRLFSMIAMLGAAFPTAAQQANEPIKLTIRPAAAPVPALKYELLPNGKDMTPGNAAQLYYRAYSPDWYGRIKAPGMDEKIEKALHTPLHELAALNLNSLLTDKLLHEVDLAARREYCDWEFTPRIKAEGIGMVLPDMQGFRTIAKLLAVRARLQMAQGHFDDAVYTLQTGYALGKHVGDAPVFICSLIGVAIPQVMNAQVEELIQCPGSPNLYWALADLPRPFISLRKAGSAEKLWLEAELPVIKDLDVTRLGPQQQKALLEQLQRMFRFSGDERNSEWQASLDLLGRVIKAYPEAKKALIAGGRKPAEVEAMPVLVVVMSHSLHRYQQLLDDVLKWHAFPYWQAATGLDQAQKQMQVARAKMEGYPFIDFLPALQKVFAVPAALEHRLAALQCIEAIRLFASRHDGRLPAALKDITEVPVPIDPVTGQPFVYRVEGDKAFLFGEGRSNSPPVLNPVRYELILKR